MPVLSNPRHERFAQELAKGCSATEAYEVAGFSPARQNASRLMANDDIKKRVDELMGRGARRAEVTIESLLQEAEEARALAMSTKQPAAAVSALTAKAKLSGLWVERAENANLNVNHDVSGEPASAEEWEAQHGTAH
jgi:phage terminase small subunit